VAYEFKLCCSVISADLALAQCHVAGGELGQIQFLLGHVSVQKTEKYPRCKQRIQDTVNDRIGIEPGP
jgi:hypothetical protein